MTDNLPPQMHGVWIPGEGWWKVRGTDGMAHAYADFRREVAEFYAGLIGHRARVQPIDKSLELSEEELKALEKERADNRWSNRLWHTLKSFWRDLNTPAR